MNQCEPIQGCDASAAKSQRSAADAAASTTGCRRRKGGHSAASEAPEEQRPNTPSQRRGKKRHDKSATPRAANASAGAGADPASPPRREGDGEDAPAAAEVEGGAAASNGSAPQSAEALLLDAYGALKEAGYEETLGKLTPSELLELASSNRKLIRLELFVMCISASAAKLPRYVAALEMHANLADRPGAADADAVAELRLASGALREALRVLGMVKTEATDMAKKLDSFSSLGI